ncbi:MAG: T9SS type A sorting domain-containing protein [Bacteroidota bacterium]|nr:T9SS type A sorting domain-containing protein [Bacteroidota bacterium]
MRNKILAIFLFVILVSTDATGFTVRGKITTTTDTVVQYARIRFVSQQDTSIIFTAITNSFGEYVITLTGASEPITVTKSFKLHQNYPNPFNPYTTIGFKIPRSMHFELSIYDLLGRKVETLLNEERVAGVHSTKWDGTRYPSGVYVYQLQTGQGSITKKLLLLR